MHNCVYGAFTGMDYYVVYLISIFIIILMKKNLCTYVVLIFIKVYLFIVRLNQKGFNALTIELLFFSLKIGIS